MLLCQLLSSFAAAAVPPAISLAHHATHRKKNPQQHVQHSQQQGHAHTNTGRSNCAPDCPQPQQPVPCERVVSAKETLRDLQRLLRMLCCLIVLVAKQQQQRGLVVQLTQLRPASAAV